MWSNLKGKDGIKPRSFNRSGCLGAGGNHILNDNFDSATLDPKWTWVNQGTSTAWISDGSLFVKSTTAATNVKALVMPAPSSGDFRAILKIGHVANSNPLGVCLVSSAGKIATLGLYYAGTQSLGTKFTNATTNAGNYAGPTSNFNSGSTYVLVRKTGTTIQLALPSVAGEDPDISSGTLTSGWNGPLNESVATFLGDIASVGLFLNGQGVIKCDWVRGYPTA